MLDRHGLDAELAGDIGDYISAGEFEAAFEAVTADMIDAFCIAGTPETAERRIAAVLEYADSFVAGAPLGPDPETAIELAGGILDRSEATH